MRFVVDLFRYIIIAFCAVVLIGVALVVMAILDQGHSLSSSMTITTLALGCAVLAILILNIGGIAILISIHDRHAEISDSAHAIAAALRQQPPTSVNDGVQR